MKTLQYVALATLLVLTTLTVVGCDEGMNMVKPVIPVGETTGEPAETPPQQQETEPEAPEIIPDDAVIGDVTQIPVQEAMGGPESPEDVPVVQEEPERRVPQPGDFVGRVYALNLTRENMARIDSDPTPDVRVTIVAGPRSGETTMTDQEGQYIFPNVGEDEELHLMVEKEGLEPKEAIVHRSRPLKLPTGIVPNFQTDPQREPGNILMGQVWPDEVRFILEQEPLIVCDLLYAKVSQEILGRWFGLYGGGIAVVCDHPKEEIILSVRILAHEIAHARQGGVTSIDGYFAPPWRESPEGKAYKEAWEKDLEEHGESNYLDRIYPLSPFTEENAAEFCMYYWSIGQVWELRSLKNLQETVQNRMAWAREWLTIQR